MVVWRRRVQGRKTITVVTIVPEAPAILPMTTDRTHNTTGQGRGTTVAGTPVVPIGQAVRRLRLTHLPAVRVLDHQVVPALIQVEAVVVAEAEIKP